MKSSFAATIVVLYCFLFFTTINGEHLFCWFLSSDATDLGWNYSHDSARTGVARLENLKMFRLANTLRANISESQQIIDDGIASTNCSLVVTVGVNFNTITPLLAAKYPHIKFLNVGGTVVSPNLANAFGRAYQARYLSGIVAGLMTTSNKLGYVAAMNNSQVNRGINAFTLGARSVNSQAEVYVVLINNFNHPHRSTIAANQLIDFGCDVITQHVDSNDPMEVAASRGVYGIGYHSDMATWISNPVQILTSVVWNWVPLYKSVINQVIQGTFQNISMWAGLETGVVDLAPFSPFVTKQLQRTIRIEKRRLMRKDRIFCGPQFEFLTGSPNGCLTDDQLLNNVTFYVDHVTLLGVVTDDPPSSGCD